MAMNPVSAYQNSKVQTASKADLVMMLYDGAIKFCNLAIAAMDENDILKSSENIIKAENIITELQGTLDFKYPVAKEFEKIYDYINWRLVTANIKKDREILEDACNEIRGMRDTWREVMKVSTGK